MVRSLKQLVAAALFFTIHVQQGDASNIIACFNDAAAYQGVNAGILMAIAITESSTCSSVVTHNSNGSRDFGCMAINETHAKELQANGVSLNDLLEPCKNIYVGAWFLKKKINKHGNTWVAVGSYHSETPNLRDAYSLRVYRNWKKYGLDRLKY